MLTVFIIGAIFVAVYFISKMGLVPALNFIYNYIHTALEWLREFLAGLLPQGTVFLVFGWADVIFAIVSLLLAWRIMRYYYVDKGIGAHLIQYFIIAIGLFAIFKWF